MPPKLDVSILCSNYRCLLRAKCARATNNMTSIPPNTPITELQNVSATECNFFIPLVREGKSEIEGDLLLS